VGKRERQITYTKLGIFGKDGGEETEKGWGPFPLETGSGCKQNLERGENRNGV